MGILGHRGALSVLVGYVQRFSLLREKIGSEIIMGLLIHLSSQSNKKNWRRPASLLLNRSCSGCMIVLILQTIDNLLRSEFVTSHSFLFQRFFEVFYSAPYLLTWVHDVIGVVYLLYLPKDLVELLAIECLKERSAHNTVAVVCACVAI
jgi:hypothetical protein